MLAYGIDVRTYALRPLCLFDHAERGHRLLMPHRSCQGVALTRIKILACAVLSISLNLCFVIILEVYFLFVLHTFLSSKFTLLVYLATHLLLTELQFMRRSRGKLLLKHTYFLFLTHFYVIGIEWIGSRKTHAKIVQILNSKKAEVFAEI